MLADLLVQKIYMIIPGIFLGQFFSEIHVIRLSRAKNLYDDPWHISESVFQRFMLANHSVRKICNNMIPGMFLGQFFQRFMLAIHLVR